ncbi:MAG: CCA tRNA nucleotidyltransferase [Actinobacteria bacterium]|nr:MAG: CCA tRNA nucleotidyltransferase [Actinomycetota bacterium]
MDTLAPPEHLEPVLDAVTAVSEPYEGVFLVGGTVRDILLGEPGFDVDIAVEGDAIALAGALAEALDGRVKAHAKFGTAVVLYGADQRVDVATARTESYHAPAALPSVEHAPLRDDLFRRDFTINAMAVSLKREDRGELFDPFEGRVDLEAGRVRVLHDRSFIDDPTRIFRAIRYENRYGFRMDEHTEALARRSIEAGHLSDLSGARVRDELELMLEEGDVHHSIVRLGELGAAPAIHAGLVADEETAALFDRLRELNERHRLGIPGWRLGFAAIARGVPSEELIPWLDALKVRRRDTQHIAAAVTLGPQIVDRLSSDSLSPAELVALAEPHAPDAPLFALALTDLPQLHEYFERLGSIRLEITGRDVAELGLGESPRVGEVLAELRRRKLNGELDGRESELAAARELIEQT